MDRKTIKYNSVILSNTTCYKILVADRVSITGYFIGYLSFGGFMRTASFHIYIITEYGQVYNEHGKLRKPIIKRGRLEMRFNTPDGKKVYPLARAIYKAFNPSFDISDINQCISFKDSNKLNVHIDNLYCVFRGDLIQGDGHRARIKINQEQAEQIKIDYQNTLSNRPINQYDKKQVYNSYRELAKKYNVTYPLIKQIIEGKTRNKNNYKLINPNSDK